MLMMLQGEVPLVVHVESADVIATLLSLKKEVESYTGSTMKLTLVGAAEAHLLAKEIGEAGVGVIVTPARPFPAHWESRRMFVLLLLNSRTYTLDEIYFILQLAWTSSHEG